MVTAGAIRLAPAASTRLKALRACASALRDSLRRGPPGSKDAPWIRSAKASGAAVCSEYRQNGTGVPPFLLPAAPNLADALTMR